MRGYPQKLLTVIFDLPGLVLSVLVFFILSIFAVSAVMAAPKAFKYDYNMATFNLLNGYNVNHKVSRWVLASPDVSLSSLELVPMTTSTTPIILIDLDKIVTTYPVDNTYIENNIRYIMVSQSILLRQLHSDQKKLKEFRKRARELLKRYFRGTDFYNRYVMAMKDRYICNNENKIGLPGIVKKKILKRVQLVQSTSQYRSLQSNVGVKRVYSANSDETNNVTYGTQNNTIFLIISETIKFIKNNWLILLGVLIYAYVMILMIRKR